MARALPSLALMAKEQLEQLRATMHTAAKTAASLESAKRQAEAAKMSNAERRELLRQQLAEEAA